MSARPTAAGVPSPCINVCRIDEASGWCEGCLRTLDEIAAWATLDDTGKRFIWQQLRGRRERLLSMQPIADASTDGGR
jgi:predicted Fe-S protein YdhL (DUF1289 family)